VVFLNKCDLTNDVEFLERVEQDVRSLLLAHGYSDDDPIIHGSATAALNSLQGGIFDIWTSKVRELLDAVDAAIPIPQNIEDKPFLMSIEDTFTISTKGTVVLGPVERGTYTTNTYVEMVGLGPTRSPMGTGLEKSHKSCNILYAGDAAAMLLRGIERTGARRGQVLAAPGTIRAYAQFKAILYLPTQQEGGSNSTNLSGPDCVFSIRSIDFTGTLQLEYTSPLRGGEVIQVTGELEAVVAMEPGLRFILRQDGRMIGFGVVTETLS
jgi:elongation factor Tu